MQGLFNLIAGSHGLARGPYFKVFSNSNKLDHENVEMATDSLPERATQITKVMNIKTCYSNTATKVVLLPPIDIPALDLQEYTVSDLDIRALELYSIDRPKISTPRTNFCQRYGEKSSSWPPTALGKKITTPKALTIT
jgi:hypothetical protein